MKQYRAKAQTKTNPTGPWVVRIVSSHKRGIISTLPCEKTARAIADHLNTLEILKLDALREDQAFEQECA